jgi:pilus assembly protein CpaB
MMRFRSVLLIGIALSLATGTGLLAKNWLDAQRDAFAARPVAAPAPVKQVLVAKDDIAIGSFVRAEHLRWQPWPDGALAPAYKLEGDRRLEDFAGSLARERIVAGEPITDAKVVTPGSSGFLAAVLKPGMRAVSVAVTVTSGISGFAFPGDRVDIMLTHVLPPDNPAQASVERRASETVLRDIRILAMDQKLESKPNEAVVARTATLEVTPKQGEIIAVVQEMGRLSLALRSLAREGEDEAPLPPRTATLDSDVSRYLPPLAGAAAKREVTVLRGGKASAVALAQPGAYPAATAGGIAPVTK